MTEVNAVDIFLSFRPEYDRDHVASMAEDMDAEGIPFCFTCADWHHSTEEHSS